MRLVGLCVVFVALASLTGACKDEHTSCNNWAHSGECEKNPPYMLHMCKVSCHLCPEVKRCHDEHEKCKSWSNRMECVKNPNYMRYFCPRSCGLCPDECKSELKPDMVIEGMTVIYGQLSSVKSWVECCKKCQEHNSCSHWTWTAKTADSHDHGCQLKCGLGKYVRRHGAMSGRNRQISGMTVNCGSYHYDCTDNVCQLD